MLTVLTVLTGDRADCATLRTGPRDSGPDQLLYADDAAVSVVNMLALLPLSL